MSRQPFIVGPSRKPEFWAAFARHEKAAAGAHKGGAKPAKPGADLHKSAANLHKPGALARPKDDAVRSEPYRRLVAAMPCKNCQVQGFSQAAHPPPSGKGIKENDLECFALCTTRAGVVEGCHPKFDQYKLMPHAKAVKQAQQWGAETREEIEAAGLWPKKLAKWKNAKPPRAKGSTTKARK